VKMDGWTVGRFGRFVGKNWLRGIAKEPRLLTEALRTVVFPQPSKPSNRPQTDRRETRG
jgi:hypothetical protein